MSGFLEDRYNIKVFGVSDKDKALETLQRQLARGHGALPSFLKTTWHEIVGDSLKEYEIRVIDGEEYQAEGKTDFTYSVRVSVVAHRGGDLRTEREPPEKQSGLPYLEKVHSKSSQAAVLGQSNCICDSGRSGSNRLGTGSYLDRFGERRRMPPQDKQAGLSRRNSRAHRPPKAELRARSAQPKGGAAKAPSQTQGGVPERSPEQQSVGTRAARAWNDDRAASWYKERRRREAENKTRTKLKEKETLEKDWSFIRRQRAVRQERAHDLKLGDPRYAYHIRRWTAATAIQRRARAHFVEWTKTDAWRTRVLVHPELRLQLFLEYARRTEWAQLEVPGHLLAAWNMPAPSPVPQGDSGGEAARARKSRGLLSLWQT